MGTPQTFNTFCVDIFHEINLNQTYAVNIRTDLATAFTNGGQMEVVYETYGLGDLSSNPDQAAAVQIALWDLSLSNHSPTTFEEDSPGVYGSGDDSIFNITFGSNPDAATIAGLVNTYISSTVGATNAGDWLDASAAGTALNRGQSLLIPPGLTNFFPEPSSLTLLLVSAGGLCARRRRRA
jgi:hypothetical protein